MHRIVIWQFWKVNSSKQIEEDLRKMRIQSTSKSAVLCLVALSCSTLWDLMDCSLPGSSVHGDSPGKNTAVGGHAHALFHGIFPTQRSNPGLPHCMWILYHLSHQGSPHVNFIDPLFLTVTLKISIIKSINLWVNKLGNLQIMFDRWKE